MNEVELIEKGYRKYVGEKIDVFFNKDICMHSANCVKGDHNIFDVNRKPWIIPDAAAEDKVAKLIDNCPSGALKYIIK